MSDHRWGDEDFDWEALEDCQRIIYKYHKRGFLSSLCKEKYGTLRWYVSFGCLSLQTLIYPGYMYNQLPKFLQKFDNNIFMPIGNKLFGSFFIWWQKKVYNWIYQKMLRKHPHIKEEILECADWPEFIKGAEEYARFE